MFMLPLLWKCNFLACESMLVMLDLWHWKAPPPKVPQNQKNLLTRISSVLVWKSPLLLWHPPLLWNGWPGVTVPHMSGRKRKGGKSKKRRRRSHESQTQRGFFFCKDGFFGVTMSGKSVVWPTTNILLIQFKCFDILFCKKVSPKKFPKYLSTFSSKKRRQEGLRAHRPRFSSSSFPPFSSSQDSIRLYPSLESEGFSTWLSMPSFTRRGL